MNAISNFFKNFLKAVASSRNELPPTTAQYFTWHLLTLVAINLIGLIVGFTYSIELYGWVCFYQVAVISPTVVGLGSLIFLSQERYLENISSSNAFESSNSHSSYYLVATIIALFIHVISVLEDQSDKTTHDNILGGSFTFLAITYAIILGSALLSQFIRVWFIPFVNKSIEALYSKK